MTFPNAILAGVTLIREAIQSRGFLTGVTGWRIERDGDAEFNDVTIRGDWQVGSDAGPHVRSKIAEFGAQSALISFKTGDTDETSEGGIVVRSDAGTAPQTLITSPGFDDNNIAAMLLQGESAGAGGVDGFPRFNFGDFFGDTPDNQGQFIVNAEMRCLFEGNTEVSQNLTTRTFPVPYRLATDRITASSGTITTTETIVATISMSVISGKRYKITADIGIAVSVPGDTFMIRTREDNASGTVLQARRPIHPTTSSPYGYHHECDFVAASTTSKTIVLTMQRTAGTGNIILAAGSTQPSYFYGDHQAAS